MKPIKTKPKFQCDFCKKRSVKHIIERHEKTCFLNPERVCYKCNNEGYYIESQADYWGNEEQVQAPCEHCAKYQEIIKSVENTEQLLEQYKVEEIPF